MKFMLMMHAPRGTGGDWGITKWPAKDIKTHMNHMIELYKELQGNGELVSAEGLAGPGEARIVRADAKGAPVVTDGPYPEAKEFLAGYWIVDTPTLERAHAIAAKASQAPGPGGTPLNLAIEVRQVLSGPPPTE